MSDQRALAAVAPETVVVPLPVCVYHVTLLDGDDSSAGGAVVGVDGVEARGAVGFGGEGDVLVACQWTVALGTDVVVDVVALTAGLRALLGEYQLHNSVRFVTITTRSVQRDCRGSTPPLTCLRNHAPLIDLHKTNEKFWVPTNTLRKKLVYKPVNSCQNAPTYRF